MDLHGVGGDGGGRGGRLRFRSTLSRPRQPPARLSSGTSRARVTSDSYGAGGRLASDLYGEKRGDDPRAARAQAQTAGEEFRGLGARPAAPPCERSLDARSLGAGARLQQGAVAGGNHDALVGGSSLAALTPMDRCARNGCRRVGDRAAHSRDGGRVGVRAPLSPLSPPYKPDASLPLALSPSPSRPLRARLSTRGDACPPPSPPFVSV